MLALRNAGMRYGSSQVLAGVTAEFSRGQLSTIVGPNGAGKSTLLGILAGLKPRHEGDALLDDQPVGRWDRAAFARKVGFVPQAVKVDFPFTVEQVVLMGRTPHAGGLFETPGDHLAAERAMRQTDVTYLRGRDFRSLSGGERQRAILASTLAQLPEAMLLDEPTTFLDLKHQIAIYQLMRELAASGLAIVAVTHDLNLAARYSDRILVLKEGRLVADDRPANALTPEMIRHVFEVEAAAEIGEDGSVRLSYGR